MKGTLLTSFDTVIDCFAISDKGAEAGFNTDQFLVADLNKGMSVYQASLLSEDSKNADLNHKIDGFLQGRLLLVADGFGHHGKEVAEFAICSLIQYVLNSLVWFPKKKILREDLFAQQLKEAFRRCQEDLQHTFKPLSSEYIKASLTMAYVCWPNVYIAHVGNCRTYLWRDRALHQVTTDHTQAQKLAEKNLLPGDELPVFPEGAKLSHAIGGKDLPLVTEVEKVEIQSEDKLLLCTDGLWETLFDGDIGLIMQQELPAQEICQQLVDLAREKNSPDNVTALVAQFEERVR